MTHYTAAVNMREQNKVLYIILFLVLYSLRHVALTLGHLALITKHSELTSSIYSTQSRPDRATSPLATHGDVVMIS